MSIVDMRWGDQVAVEMVGGVPYRMYTDRPRRVESLIPFAIRWANRPHIFQADRVLTFEQTAWAIAAKARELKALAVKPGDRVFLLAWNGPEWVVNFWACIQVGAVPVLANAWWSAAEVSDALDALRPVMTLADARCAEKVPAQGRLGPWAIEVQPTFSGDAGTASGASQDEEDTALIIFTSGTSGRPKAVVLSHRAVLARLHMTLHVTRKLPHQIDARKHDVTLITGPLFHVGGMQTLLRAFVTGDTLVLPAGRFDPGEVLALIEQHKIKRWNAVPTMVSRVLDHEDARRRNVSSLKSISIGGAPVHAELMRRIHETLPSVSPKIPTGYGLTENGGQATAAAGSEDVALLGSTGKPLSCVEVSFLTHEGLPDGEVLLRSPTQMSGYFGIDESPIDAQGWLHTGDLGRLDDQGNLWITGRCKDMIIRGGENIAPAAIESALMALPGVTEAVVFGVPHPDLGEEVMAVVVVDGQVTRQQLNDQLRARISSFAVPSQWRLQTTPLATNDNGKVDKAKISAQARAELAAKGAVQAS